jgi:hypothetical protein
LAEREGRQLGYLLGEFARRVVQLLARNDPEESREAAMVNAA